MILIVKFFIGIIFGVIIVFCQWIDERNQNKEEKTKKHTARRRYVERENFVIKIKSVY